MANLDFLERESFEMLFDMGGGYVLDFSNRTFEEFVYEKIEINIYKRYPNLSKAKILRAIINDFDDKTVGKLFLELLRYMKVKKLIREDHQDLFNECVKTGNKLIGRTNIIKPVVEKNRKEETQNVDFLKFKDELLKLLKIDSAQARGFAFERFLKCYFEDSGLDPRGSFKIEGEQIDGSFILHNEIYLLEAKWTSKKIDKGDLVEFNEKVSSKSNFTRGLYISYSGYSEEALNTFDKGRKISIVLMTVEELYDSIDCKRKFQEIVWEKFRALAEEGEFFKKV